MKHSSSLRKMLFVAAPVLGATHAFGWTVLTSGHYDIGADIDTGEPHGHIHQHSPTDMEFELDEAGFWAKDNHLAVRPSGSAWDFIGVASGQSYYRLPQNNQTGKLYIGFGVEEIDPAAIDPWTVSDPRVDAIYGTDPGPFIKWSLKSVYSSTGGAFSVWNGTSSADPVWISSADGIDSSDFFVQQAGGHDHVNYGFSKAGLYGITFTITTSIGGSLKSADALYTFGIGDGFEPTGPVPEPASFAALGLGVLIFGRRRRK